MAIGRTDTTTGTGFFSGDTEFTAAPYSSGRLSISYNAGSNSYTVRDGTRSREFFPADIRPSDQSNGEAFVNYSQSPGSRDSNHLSLYRPTGGGGEVALTYTTLAQWTRRTVTDVGAVTESRTEGFWAVGGFETIASDMPRTGTATYIGPLRGLGVRLVPGLNAETFLVTGQSRLAANFGAGTVVADLFANRPGFSTMIISGSGPISGSRFSGTLNGSGYSGAFDGAFFGPGAAEMGFSFLVSDGAGGQIAGVGAGRQ